uniref:AlNc14C6G839 protein n=1 Tax=Albugo laibachii Nc14 TaxID=890382 RepID=F0W163_9STRA|nr:AlNc14C6G839 [Albugo laibachii Nc14]|eukprot:CCA14788.1 AlNc14C6G839 [Albugo laibachii Nc14]
MNRIRSLLPAGYISVLCLTSSAFGRRSCVVLTDLEPDDLASMTGMAKASKFKHDCQMLVVAHVFPDGAKSEYDILHHPKKEHVLMDVEMGHHNTPKVEMRHHNTPEVEMGDHNTPKVEMRHHNTPEVEMGDHNTPEAEKKNELSKAALLREIFKAKGSDFKLYKGSGVIPFEVYVRTRRTDASEAIAELIKDPSISEIRILIIAPSTDLELALKKFDTGNEHMQKIKDIYWAAGWGVPRIGMQRTGSFNWYKDLIASYYLLDRYDLRDKIVVVPKLSHKYGINMDIKTFPDLVNVLHKLQEEKVFIIEMILQKQVAWDILIREMFKQNVEMNGVVNTQFCALDIVTTVLMFSDVGRFEEHIEYTLTVGEIFKGSTAPKLYVTYPNEPVVKKPKQGPITKAHHSEDQDPGAPRIVPQYPEGYHLSFTHKFVSMINDVGVKNDDVSVLANGQHGKGKRYIGGGTFQSHFMGLINQYLPSHPNVETPSQRRYIHATTVMRLLKAFLVL